jgi:hypothetical protein
VLAQLPWPGPLSEGVREIKLGKARHSGLDGRESWKKRNEADWCQYCVDVRALYTAVLDQRTALTDRVLLI